MLIKGGTVVNAHHKEVADVYIEDGIIVAVQPNIKVTAKVSLFSLSLLIDWEVNNRSSVGKLVGLLVYCD